MAYQLPHRQPNVTFGFPFAAKPCRFRIFATLAEGNRNELRHFWQNDRVQLKPEIQSSRLLTIRPKKDDIGRYMMALDERSP